MIHLMYMFIAILLSGIWYEVGVIDGYRYQMAIDQKKLESCHKVIVGELYEDIK